MPDGSMSPMSGMQSMVPNLNDTPAAMSRGGGGGMPAGMNGMMTAQGMMQGGGGGMGGMGGMQGMNGMTSMQSMNGMNSMGGMHSYGNSQVSTTTFSKTTQKKNKKTK